MSQDEQEWNELPELDDLDVNSLFIIAENEQVRISQERLARLTRDYHEYLVSLGYPEGAAHDLARDWHQAQLSLATRLQIEKYFEGRRDKGE